MKVLIVYYSRSGVTRKAAEAVRSTLAAAIEHAEVTVEEIADRTDRTGVLGWFRAGYSAWRKRPTEIGPVKSDLAAYDLVVIGTPVWAWTAATPVRVFCEQQGGKAKRVAFFCTMGGSGDKGAFAALTTAAGKTPLATMALTQGKVMADHVEYVTRVKEFAVTIAGALRAG